MESPFHRRLRWASLAVWAVLVGPFLAALPSSEIGPTLPSCVTSWFGLWLTFGAAFAIATSPKVRGRVRIAALALQTGAALNMAYIKPDIYVGFLLVVVAAEAAVFLPMRAAAAWTLIQTALLLILFGAWARGHWTTVAVDLIFQGFAVMGALLVREAQARELEQARLNAELAATAELLMERSRARERLRISQDLHDALGHRLTVLSLDLEVARNTADPELRSAHLAKALESAKEAMAVIRQVVGALRNIEPPQVHATLQKLAARTGDLQVHVAADPNLKLEDADQAHALVSCAQEVITNVLKHAGAKNLWIDVALEAGQVVVRARDDGHGATPEPAAAGSGFGLKGMRDRLAGLGGGLEIADHGARGFALRAWFPLSQA